MEAKRRNLAYLDECFSPAFFDSLTHDLKTPVTAIKGASELLLLQNCRINPKCREYQEVIHRNINRLARIIQNILDLSRLRHNKLDIYFDTCDLAEIVEDAMLRTINAAWENGINLNYMVPDRTFDINGDQDRLEQAVSDMLSYAVNISGPDSDVSVNLFGSDGFNSVRIVFRDEEMSETMAAELFSKYLEGDANMKRREHWLNLAVARAITRLHNGDLVIEASRLPEISLTLNLPEAGSMHKKL